MAIALRYAARSDIGLGRYVNNQDSAYAGPHLLVVADGMGGHAAGDVASSTAIARLVTLDDEAPGGDTLERLTLALADANQDLRDRVAAEPELAGMGTTVTALLRSGAKLALAHIGDSRGYLLREGVLTQITHDHTFVQSLVDDGRITEDEARSHPQRNLITRVLTGERDDTPDLSVREAKVGDVYLLCSDGLTGVVSEETLTDVLGEPTDVGTRAERLLDLALKGGAADNVTCIVADIVDLDTDDGPSTVPEVVGAAAAHEISTTTADAGTPAGKAAALARQARAADQDTGSGDLDVAPVEDLGDGHGRPRRRRGLAVLLVLVVLLLVGGGGYAAYGWSQRQYYVGTSGGDVAIFRGLPESVGPINLSKVYERQDLPVATLPSYWRDQVQQSIAASDLPGARQVVDNLRQQVILCAGATPSPSATATGSSIATATGTSTAKSPHSTTATPSATATTPASGASTTECGDG